MNKPRVNAERVTDDVARQLLERATALETDGSTLEQLRQAATEAGISRAAFDAAVAEWRAGAAPAVVVPAEPLPWAARALRNAAGLASGWVAVGALAAAQRLVDAPWLVHKLTDPLGLAIGAVVAARLRARTATVLLGGLAVAQGAEFLMDLLSGAPAIRGLGAHLALMAAGVAGVAVGRMVWERRGPPGIGGPGLRDAADNAPYAASALEITGQMNAEAVRQSANLLRIAAASA